jgi:hypothetical protein
MITEWGNYHQLQESTPDGAKSMLGIKKTVIKGKSKYTEAERESYKKGLEAGMAKGGNLSNTGTNSTSSTAKPSERVVKVTSKNQKYSNLPYFGKVGICWNCGKSDHTLNKCDKAKPASGGKSA